MEKTRQMSVRITIITDHRRPWPVLHKWCLGTDALPAFKVEIDALLGGTHIVSTWKHYQANPQLGGVSNEVPMKPQESGVQSKVECGVVSRWWG